MSRPCARVGADRASLYDDITNKIIAELGVGRFPWVQPWGTAAAKAPLAMPKNAATGRRYSGINVLLLWVAVTASPSISSTWYFGTVALLASNSMRNVDYPRFVAFALGFPVLELF